MSFITVAPGTQVKLPKRGAIQDQDYILEKPAIDAVNAAIAARRPLLVRGEPGIGKSELARAVAESLGHAFVDYSVDSQTEPHDLLWHFDAVGRLAEAQ